MGTGAGGGKKGATAKTAKTAKKQVGKGFRGNLTGSQVLQGLAGGGRKRPR